MSTTSASTVTDQNNPPRHHSPELIRRNDRRSKSTRVGPYQQHFKLATNRQRHQGIKKTPAAQASLQSNYQLSEGGCNSPVPLADRCSKVLKFTKQSQSCENNCAVFHHITQEEYDFLSEELAGKARLAYNRNTLKLVVEMASLFHESTIKLIIEALSRTDKTLQDLIPERLLYALIHSNLIIDEEALSFTPDIAYAISTFGQPFIKDFPIFCEVAMSQPQNVLLAKLKDVVRAFPDTLVIIMVIIRERPPYKSPKPNSMAWRSLTRDSRIRTFTNFANNVAELPSSESRRPTEIVFSEHTWCSLPTIDLQVWTRGSEPINIDANDSHVTARGQLFPNKTMDDINVIIKRGLSLLRDKYVSFSKAVRPNLDVTALEAADMTSPFNWDDILNILVPESISLAYNRYKSWYIRIKRLDAAEVIHRAPVPPDEGPAMYTRARTARRAGRTANISHGPGHHKQCSR